MPAAPTPDDGSAFICPHCSQPAIASTRGTAEWLPHDHRGIPTGPPVQWMLVTCQSCSTPSLWAREDYGGGFHQDDRPVLVYPAPRRLSSAVPASLRREWNEARTCFDAKAYAACVVMVRRTLEGTCRELGVGERTLHKALARLKADGHIDTMLAEWADALRVIGNQGAHYTGDVVSREDAEDSLAFAEALLDYLYALRNRFEEFKARRSSREGDA